MPKNAAANTANRRKNTRLVIQWVVTSVMKSAPRPANETSNPSRVYMATILTPKTNALIRAFILPFFPRKKLTVIGIMGNTQGVSSPASPARKLMMMKTAIGCPASPPTWAETASPGVKVPPSGAGVEFDAAATARSPSRAICDAANSAGTAT